VGRRAVAIATELDDFELQIVANFHLGQVHWALGDYRAAIERTLRVVRWLEGDLIRHRFGLPVIASVLARTWLVWSMAECGEFLEEIVHGEEEIRIAESVGHPGSLVDAYTGLGVVRLRQGDFPAAVALLECACELARRWEVHILFQAAAGPLGYAYAFTGRTGRALSLLEETVERSAAMSMSFGQALWMSFLAESYLTAERVHEAFDHAGRALRLARSLGQRGHEAYALRLVGDIRAHGDAHDPPRAEESYRQAAALAEGLGMRPLVAHCHLDLGKLDRRTCKRQEAQEHLTTATTMYREMGMRFWLEKAEAELSELS
jgi:tetratricopeptide (TPR) repeat protein